MKFADLHQHTRYSDGTTSPRQNVVDSALLGLEAIAIADHDNTLGYYEAFAEACRWGIEVIPAVEISTREYHLLGYGFDIENKELQDLLERSRDIQRQLTAKRVEVLACFGVPITMDKVYSDVYPGARLGKFNIVRAMIADPECRRYMGTTDSQEIFSQYMSSSGKVGKVSMDEAIQNDEAIAAIHSAEGIAVLAHGFKDVDDMSEVDALLLMGLDGLEIQPHYGKRNDPFRSYAEQRGLVVTYGSDYHGPRYLDRTMLPRSGNLVEEFWK